MAKYPSYFQKQSRQEYGLNFPLLNSREKQCYLLFKNLLQILTSREDRIKPGYLRYIELWREVIFPYQYWYNAK